MSGFTRISKKLGILHFLSMIYKMRSIASKSVFVWSQPTDANQSPESNSHPTESTSQHGALPSPFPRRADFRGDWRLRCEHGRRRLCGDMGRYVQARYPGAITFFISLTNVGVVDPWDAMRAAIRVMAALTKYNIEREVSTSRTPSRSFFCQCRKCHLATRCTTER